MRTIFVPRIEFYPAGAKLMFALHCDSMENFHRNIEADVELM